MKNLTGPQLVFDHIAIVARTLEEGADYVRQCLGIEMPTGGQHPKMGTHNLLLALSDTEFLEVIAINPDAPSPPFSRWYGLDEFDGPPRIDAWVAGTPDMAQSLECAPDECGEAIDVTRGHLSWKFSLADNGKAPMDGAFPTFIEWLEGSHPAKNMQTRGCRLEKFEIYHPNADEIEFALTDQFSDPRFMFIKGPNAFKAFIETPTGTKILS